GHAPKVALLGSIEAQLLEADLVSIAGASDEWWRKSSEKNNFWMTKSMLEHFGIPSTNEKNKFLGDIFKRLLHKRNVLVTLSTLAGGMRRQRYEYLNEVSENLQSATWLRSLIANLRKSYKSEAIKFDPPNPELHLRPLRFWASDLDLLNRNPYAFYAHKILKLTEINYLNKIKNVRGNYMHQVLEQFVKNAKDKRSVDELRFWAKKVLQNSWLTASDLGIWFFQLDEVFSFIVRHMEKKSCYAEVCGECSIKISDDCEATICSRADRIDVGENISIIDYKTGGLPTKNEVESGEKMQLPIEAIIAAQDGFGLKKTEVESLCFWKLGASKDENKISYGGEIKKVFSGKDEVCQLSEKILEFLKNLIYRYNVMGEAYDINVHSKYDEPYAHLARVKEWIK
ncbi:MAG: PD-(D/E)XK nuclease family protein, partial [Holosporaceae bacterium]|nr:PD-(D/E)XK nuclease family protein [Holosporaceae bacterium]